MIWHWNMLLCMHHGTETEQWGINVILLLQETFPHYLAMQNPNTLSDWRKTQKMNLNYSLLLRYIQTDRLLCLSNATEHTSRKKSPNPQRDEGNLTALRDQCDPIKQCHGTIIKKPCHYKTGNIFHFLLYKIKIILCLTMDVLRVDDTWQ